MFVIPQQFLFVIPQRSGGICGCFVTMLSMPKREYDFFVYIAASRSHQLYVGFTNSLERRMKEHRERRAGTYTARYNIDRLVYYEHFQYVMNAISRETELKDWNRAKKLALINSVNPTWRDLSEDCGTLAPSPATADSSAALRNDKQKEMPAPATPDLFVPLRNDKQTD